MDFSPEKHEVKELGGVSFSDCFEMAWKGRCLPEFVRSPSMAPGAHCSFGVCNCFGLNGLNGK